jgi:AcrR family transcriptional regulator
MTKREKKSLRRMPPEDRRAQILEAAIEYFSEAGFASQTRELSKRIGISQPLLYRYFPSKNALIQEVFQVVFLNQWDPQWVDTLKRRGLSLRDRLVQFYHLYAKATYRAEWIRIYMYAGLAGMSLNDKYLQIVRDRLLVVMCNEFRQEFLAGHPRRAALSKLPVSRREIEMAWNLHGSMFYWAVRSNIFKAGNRLNFDQKTFDAVDLFLAGAKTLYPAILLNKSGDKNSLLQKTKGSASKAS